MKRESKEVWKGERESIPVRPKRTEGRTDLGEVGGEGKSRDTPPTGLISV